MRLLPRKRSSRQKAIIYATFDYYGTGLKENESLMVRNTALFIMGRQSRVSLSEQQQSDIWAIRKNIKDKLYVSGLMSNPPRTP